MARLVGVDGCPKGWVAASLGEGAAVLDVCVHRHVAEVLAAYPDAVAIAVDIPLGLSESGDRACDRQARALLGRPRASSVFPTPIRPVLSAPTREQASRLRRAVDGRGVGAQAFALVARVREWDTVLRQHPSAAQRVFEAHPEVSFWALNGERALAASKRNPPGRRRGAGCWPMPSGTRRSRRPLLPRPSGRSPTMCSMRWPACGPHGVSPKARPDRCPRRQSRTGQGSLWPSGTRNRFGVACPLACRFLFLFGVLALRSLCLTIFAQAGRPGLRREGHSCTIIHALAVR